VSADKLKNIEKALDGKCAPLNRAQLAAIVAKTNALGADMIALTGDLVDGSVKTYASEVAPIGDLKAAHGVYFVTGNHEYYSGHRAWCDEVARLGLTVLNNEHRIVSWGGARLLVGGVTDFTGGQFDPDHASDPKKALAGAAQHDFRPDRCEIAFQREFHVPIRVNEVAG
jgi:predicted MPP superfamily phosphohydrolase